MDEAKELQPEVDGYDPDWEKKLADAMEEDDQDDDE